MPTLPPGDLLEEPRGRQGALRGGAGGVTGVEGQAPTGSRSCTVRASGAPAGSGAAPATTVLRRRPPHQCSLGGTMLWQSFH